MGEITCPECEGTGYVVCVDCDGSGRVTEDTDAVERQMLLFKGTERGVDD